MSPTSLDDQAGRYERTLPRARRRAGGVFYTPPEIVAEILDGTLTPALARATWRDGAPRLRVLDPAAGAGRFLVAAEERIAAAARARGLSPARARRAAAGCVVGVERDPAAARLLTEALGPGADVRVGEALAGGVIEDGAYDVVVGNPPFLQRPGLAASDPALLAAIDGRLAATSGREWDLAGAFLERSLDWVAPDGAIGLVTPSRWLTAAHAAPLRELLGRRRAVRRVVDFGARQLFAGATVYTALVFLSPRPSPLVEVVRDGEAPGALPTAGLGARPWRLVVGAAAALVERLRAAGPRLADVARVAKGAGSSADDVFLLSPEAARGLEPELLVPCLRGRDVRPYAASPGRVALLPYDGARLLEPEELARFPRALAHLARARGVLEAREGGRFAGPRFYRWGRLQNLVFHRDRAAKIVVPDAAARGRAALDRAGLLVADTAYAVRPLDGYPPGLLLAVLNSPVVAAWLTRTGIPLRGGYFRMKTDYLADLPLPDPTTAAASRVATAALEPAPDDEEMGVAVAKLYDVSVEELSAAARRE